MFPEPNHIAIAISSIIVIVSSLRLIVIIVMTQKLIASHYNVTIKQAHYVYYILRV